MRFGVLGPLEVMSDDGDPVDVGGRQARIVLAALIAASGRPVSADALIETIWPDREPATASGTLQTYVSRLRRALGAVDLVFDHAGYRLDLTGHTVDLVRFDELAAAGHAELVAGRPVAARRALREALALWRGPALVELVDQGASLAQAAALEEQRLTVLEARIDADLALGRHAHVVGELQALATEHPLREGLHARCALALYRSGRQAEALRAIADAGRELRDELGLEPSRELRELEQGILDHDPALDPPALATVRLDDDATGNPFVGRHRELHEMLGLFSAAATDAQFVVLEGEPGIGKTRLASEFAAVAAGRGALAVWARANELGATQALWPWLEASRAVIAAMDEAPAVLDGLLADPAGLPGRGGAGQFERFDALASLFERAGAVTPMVVVVDDLQWCDATSLELLRFLVTRLRRGVVVVITVRTLEVGRRDDVTDTLGAIARRPGGRRLRLDGLSLADTGALLATLADRASDDGLPERIHDRAEGNPFYTLELARLLDQPGGADDEVPATVRDAIRRRLGLLPEPTVDLLAVAAVVGRSLDLPLVAAVAGIELGECVDRLEPAAECRMLIADRDAPSLRFSHALVREVLIDGLTPLRRAQLHLQVADAMEHNGVGDDDIELVADHLWHAASLGVGDRAASALERAADVAVARVGYASAEVLIRRAIQLRRVARPTTAAQESLLGAHLRLLEVMQATRYFSGTDRELLQATQQLAARLGHDGISRELAWSEWAALSRRAEVAEAGVIAQRYVTTWGDDPSPSVRASAATVDGVSAWSRGRIDDAIAHLDRAVALLRDAPPPSRPLERELPLVAESFRRYCHAAHGTMTPEHALAGFDELLRTLPPTAVDGRHQLVLALACRVAAVHAQWDALGALVDRALELDPAAQFAFFGGQLLLYRALVEARRGELDAALVTFTDGRARYRTVGGRTGLPTCQALLAELLASGGRVADAAELAAGARQQIVETGETVNEVPVCIAEGRVAFAAGDVARATERLAAAAAAGERQGAHALALRAEDVAADLALDRRVDVED